MILCGGWGTREKPADLKRSYAPHRLLDITVSGEGVDALAEVAKDPPRGVTVVAAEELQAQFQIDPTEVAVAVVIAEISARAPVTDLAVREPEMEGIIREIYEAKSVTT